MHAEGERSHQPDPGPAGTRLPCAFSHLHAAVAVLGTCWRCRLFPRGPQCSFPLQWHSLSREEQAKYYELARKERQLHSQLYPTWSARDNYVSVTHGPQRCGGAECLGTPWCWSVSPALGHRDPSVTMRPRVTVSPCNRDRSVTVVSPVSL